MKVRALGYHFSCDVINRGSTDESIIKFVACRFGITTSLVTKWWPVMELVCVYSSPGSGKWGFWAFLSLRTHQTHVKSDTFGKCVGTTQGWNKTGETGVPHFYISPTCRWLVVCLGKFSHGQVSKHPNVLLVSKGPSQTQRVVTPSDTQYTIFALLWAPQCSTVWQIALPAWNCILWP